MKPKLLTILFSSILAQGCTSLNTRTISWEKVSREELSKICLNASNREKYKDIIDGCSFYTMYPCKVFTRNDLIPNSILEQLTLGHEILHCFKQDYHKEGKVF